MHLYVQPNPDRAQGLVPVGTRTVVLEKGVVEDDDTGANLVTLPRRVASGHVLNLFPCGESVGLVPENPSHTINGLDMRAHKLVVFREYMFVGVNRVECVFNAGNWAAVAFLANGERTLLLQTLNESNAYLAVDN